MNRFLPSSALVAAASVIVGCSSPATDTAPEIEPSVQKAPVTTVFATTTILGSVLDDIVSCVDNPAIAVDVLMPIGADPHDFAPSSEQMALMAGAGIIVANGLGLEGGLDDTLDQLEADGVTVLHVAEWIDPLPFAEMATDDHDHGHEEEHYEEEGEGDEHAHGEFDPHFWLDMSRMADVAKNLGAELEPLLGAEAPQCADEVALAILEAEQEVVDTLSAIAEDRRLLVTDHEAFSYFAARYEFEIAGVVIPGGSTLAEPSSQELAALVATIEELSVPALMGNIHEQSDLLTAVAAESGNLSVVSLYVGSVGGPDSEAADYPSTMLTNAQLIADALSAG